MMESKLIKSREELEERIEELIDTYGEPKYISDRHRLNWEFDEGTIQLRLPYDLLLNEDEEILWDKEFYRVICIIQSSMASVGLFKGEECLSHKVFSAYMVRKKQGKSQIKHLKTKGKSRAGSRIRLASGVEFFEDINTRLQSHFDSHPIERIIFSCSKILLPHFYGAKVPVPFEKKDKRLIGIPRHIEKPTHEQMMKTNRFLNFSEEFKLGVN